MLQVYSLQLSYTEDIHHLHWRRGTLHRGLKLIQHLDYLCGLHVNSSMKAFCL